MHDAKPSDVFISYSHEDSEFLEELREHLKPYVRDGDVTSWDDTRIAPGSRWYDEITKAMTSAKVAVLLASPAFIASDFIHEHELGPLLKRAQEGGVVILWIQVRACSYEETPLKDLQGLLLREKPFEEMGAERNRAWVQVCKAIQRAIEDSANQTPEAAEPDPVNVIDPATPVVDPLPPTVPSESRPRPVFNLHRNRRIVVAMASIAALFLTLIVVMTVDRFFFPGDIKPPPQASPKSVKNSIGMEFILIPAGKFTMGSDASVELDEKSHEVMITKPFLMSVYEVTQWQYEQVMKVNPSWFSAEGGGNAKVAGLDTKAFPVETVTWWDAVTFCHKLTELENENLGESKKMTQCYKFEGDKKVTLVDGDGYRLPTEAEWEYACRAGGKGVYPFGNDAKQLGEFAWFGEPFDKGHTYEVGEKKANSFGLYDMLGNVWEWCWDEYDAEYYLKSPLSDPLGPSGVSGPAGGTFRVSRGGSWRTSAPHTRPAYRDWRTPAYSRDLLGFRVARVPSGERVK